MTPSPRVLVVGEALVDVVQRPDGRTERHPGGSPANVALGLARLAHPVRFATRIGADDEGRLVRERLERDGVVLADGSLVAAPTSTASAVLDATGAASYVFDLVWDLPPLDLADAGHLHTGSIAAHLAPGAARVHELFAAAGPARTTSYDPNLRPRVIGRAQDERAVVERLVAGSDVVKVSDEDLAWLYPGEPAAQVCRRWAQQGPGLVVLTQGSAGAAAWLAGDPAAISVPARPVQVLDTVGAGDAFMAGLLSGLLDLALVGGPAQRGALHAASAPALMPALRRAVLASSLTCGRAGADPPTRAELLTA